MKEVIRFITCEDTLTHHCILAVTKLHTKLRLKEVIGIQWDCSFALDKTGTFPTVASFIFFFFLMWLYICRWALHETWKSCSSLLHYKWYCRGAAIQKQKQQSSAENLVHTKKPKDRAYGREGFVKDLCKIQTYIAVIYWWPYLPFHLHYKDQGR